MVVHAIGQVSLVGAGHARDNIRSNMRPEPR